MYWADRSVGRIQSASLDGSGAVTVVAGLHAPYQLALDVAGGKMYWTEYRIDRIRFANLDGSELRELPPLGQSDPVIIALDAAAGKMYWTEHHDIRDEIRSADLDGSHPHDLVNAGPGSVSGLALDPAASKMYWTDAASNRIRRANLDGFEAEDVATSGLTDPVGHRPRCVARPPPP